MAHCAPQLLFHSLLSCCVLICFCGRVNAEQAAIDLLFERDVRPILKAHCWHCHGEEQELRGGLDARLVRSLVEGGESGPAVVAGNHESSLLYQRIVSGDMPPADTKLSEQELQVLIRWIDGGALTARPEPEGLPIGEILTEEDRRHWAFQPIRMPEIPAVKNQELIHSPIDAFLLSKLEANGLSFSPQADKETLVRRLYFDLTGLPPTPDAIDRFLSAESDDAWPLLVDELLASPACAERWARHWLDVVGYADSDGYTEKDTERKWAFKYRDYVIQALIDDKPWDQFLVEQLAGDELLNPPYQDLTPEQAVLLTATGFLRMAPDGTADSSADQNVARNDVVAETIRVVSTSLLGLSVGCAQCHEHRYDPITQEDYYRLRAIFEPAYDWQNWRTPANRLVSLWSADVRNVADSVDAELKEVAAKRTEELDQIVNETFERELKKLPHELQSLARTARETSADKRTEEQKQLIKQYPFLNVSRGSVYLYLPDRLNGFNKKWDALTAETKKKRPDEDLVMCLTEVPGKVPTTKLFSRGDYQQPRQDVAPGELTVLNSYASEIPLDDPQVATSGRRLAYARHLTSGQHPLVARVLVNRFWMHHFGRGIVATTADFGVKGERPSHPELLDWLAADFMQNGWSLKRLHRQILMSAAWRQSSVRRDALEAVDPDNLLLGRMSIRRLEAETVRDALLAVSGQLNSGLFGSPIPVSPDDVGQIVLAADNRDSAGRPSGKLASLGEDEFRRSIYAQVRRSMPLSTLEPFDLPTMTPNCEQRVSSTGPSQSLLMMNNPFVMQTARALAERIQREAGLEPSSQVEQAWRLIFGRHATAADVESGVVFLSQNDGASEDQKRMALSYLCHALISSNGFLYVD